MAELTNTLTGITPMAPATLQETPSALKVPDVVGTDKSLSQDIKTLQGAQQKPNTLIDFQKVMAMSSQLAYKDRQASEMKLEAGAFDPTKVSGGTFASIISNLEQNRGADVGKIYASTMNAYASAQEQITNRLQFMQQLKQSQDQFKAELDLKKKQIKQQMKLDKEGAKLAKKKLDQEQKNWEREFALAQQKTKSDLGGAGVYGDNFGMFSALFDKYITSPESNSGWHAPMALPSQGTVTFGFGK